MKNMRFILTLMLAPIVLSAWAQKKTYKAAADTSRLTDSGTVLTMPFNRLIQSAGTVVTYGNPALENHTLDITVLPNRQQLAVEDRYGIAVLDATTKQIKARWSYADNAAYKGFMSTYSGITSFRYSDKDYIVWSAQGSDSAAGVVMTTEWNGQTFTNTATIQFKAEAPAKYALPNQVIVQQEAGTPYLYVVLNGNNKLVKVNFTNNQAVWSANTGVAPFGICVVYNKAYVTNWAGPTVTDTTMENAGTPWGSAYTNPATGGTRQGSVSIIDIESGKNISELTVGLHPNAIIKSPENNYVYVANGNSDFVSVISTDAGQVIDSIPVGLFNGNNAYFGSSPNGLGIDSAGTTLYVANGLDNAIAVVALGKAVSTNGMGKTSVKGYIPTEAYPSAIALLNKSLYITNLEAKGARVLSEARDFKQPDGKLLSAFTIHKELASLSIIGVPSVPQLKAFTKSVKELNLFYRVALTNQLPRKNTQPKPVPERIGEPSLFKHVVYIIKENKTYDQVFGDIQTGRGDNRLCIYGQNITPNQHELATRFSLLDNYYASGKSSAEGHQWTDAAMVSDYVQKNVRAWFRSYPHRQADALVYNKNGFIWNNALDHGKKVRVFGEACTSVYDNNLKWSDIYNKYVNHEPFEVKNVTTIARLRPIINAEYPDCDNITLSDQLRADAFIKEWTGYENEPGNTLPDLMVLSLPNDHTAGTSPGFPTPRAMVADNDLALGRIIQTITNSRFWDSTVVFVTEDDSQSGWDHISSYRTTGLVISPYSVLGKTVRTNYNQTSIVRTIEQILGIPPMNIIDATALPMFDCFNTTKKAFNYHYLANNIPLNEMNRKLATLTGKALYYARLSKNSSFKEVDGGDDDNMNKILWFDAKGNQKYPRTR